MHSDALLASASGMHSEGDGDVSAPFVGWEGDGTANREPGAFPVVPNAAFFLIRTNRTGVVVVVVVVRSSTICERQRLNVKDRRRVTAAKAKAIELPAMANVRKGIHLEILAKLGRGRKVAKTALNWCI
uniref:Uncharacterized protein n=1 Tax=Globodera rostochiensis TaxID=31243 RepID=A0A914HBC4_GLORO